ncbi:uncharacterized protein MYCFIDRAFT_209093 [Pseudocercospora fijiensis CIRAD86]|uniref:Uncharacterized protein n=1 Tax=Pseudocercospora fijiensis (strain CIRAD86) TaxID=383855 RepID=M2ZIG6_PSEFD|nr:uncharacterized protein MYCFIDRAFT_209093 [Pseudocercospora fijiensis CIRAD86]EME78909.1 hypothetical protein MYCFIDRAFT_209093 [Pseudocercospora fijiensis CIRAD86]
MEMEKELPKRARETSASGGSNRANEMRCNQTVTFSPTELPSSDDSTHHLLIHPRLHQHVRLFLNLPQHFSPHSTTADPTKLQSDQWHMTPKPKISKAIDMPQGRYLAPMLSQESPRRPIGTGNRPHDAIVVVTTPRHPSTASLRDSSFYALYGYVSKYFYTISISSPSFHPLLLNLDLDLPDLARPTKLAIPKARSSFYTIIACGRSTTHTMNTISLVLNGKTASYIHSLPEKQRSSITTTTIHHSSPRPRPQFSSTPPFPAMSSPSRPHSRKSSYSPGWYTPNEYNFTLEDFAQKLNTRSVRRTL